MALCKTRLALMKSKEATEKRQKNIAKLKKSVVNANKIGNQKKREERLEKKREAERERRRKIKENPELYEQYLQKEKERNEKRKKTGKIKTVSQLTDREKRLLRKKQNERKRKSRSHLKEKEHLAKSPEKQCMNAISKQNAAGQKLAKKNKMKMRKTISKLTEQNRKMQKSLNRLEKRLQRCKQTNNHSFSPKSTVEKFLKGRSVQDDVKQRLLSGEIVMHQLRETYREKNNLKTKQILARILCGKIIKKYRKIVFVKRYIAPIHSSKQIPQAKHASIYCERKNSSSAFLKNKVTKFYEENSTINPSKQASKTVNDQQITKRFMNASILDLHTKYNHENYLRISYSTFAKLRPAYCIAPKVSHRDTCACFTHENFSLLIAALYKMKVIRENTLEKMICNIVCAKRSEDCLQRSCDACKMKDISVICEAGHLNQEMHYEKWQTCSENRVNETTKNPISVKVTAKKKIICTVEKAIVTFKEEREKFMAHEYRRIHQKTHVEKLIANVSNEEMVFLIDFSENYACKYGTEVHSVHFGASRAQCTLHTGMCYTSSHSQGFATMSESLRHDPSAIIAHLKKILDVQLPKFPQVKSVHFISDGPTTQYRNRKMFNLITQYLTQLYPQLSSLSYNFTEAGHGKGPADGIGGSLKKIADDQVKYGHDIPDFHTFVETLQTRVKNTYLDTVTRANIEDVDLKLPSEIDTFVGTMKVHQYTWSKQTPTLVFFNSLSCFQCAIGTKCEHYFMGNLSFDIDSGKVVQKRGTRKRKLPCEDKVKRVSTIEIRKENDQCAARNNREIILKTKVRDVSIIKSTPQRKSLRIQNRNKD